MTDCACGCGEQLPANSHPSRRYISEQHKYAARRVEVQAFLPPMKCHCGCGTEFTPRNRCQRFVSKEHRDKYHGARRTVEGIAEKVPTDTPGTLVVIRRTCSEDEAQQNRATIDEQIRRFNQGELAAVRL